MGLREDIQTDIGAAFDTDLADAARPFEYHSIEVGDHDPTTGATQQHTTIVSSRGVFDKVTMKQLQNSNVKPTDGLLLVLQNELDAAPRVDDELVMRNKRYVVIDVAEDPAAATWEMVIRG